MQGFKKQPGENLPLLKKSLFHDTFGLTGSGGTSHEKITGELYRFMRHNAQFPYTQNNTKPAKTGKILAKITPF